jgi:hypothetical protein
MDANRKTGKSILVVQPGLSFEWIIWSVEFALSRRLDGDTVYFLDLGSKDRSIVSEYPRRFLHFLMFRNCIHRLPKIVLSEFGVKTISLKKVWKRNYSFNAEMLEIRFSSALDATYGQRVGHRILGKTDLPSRIVRFQKRRYLQNISLVMAAIKKYDIDSLVTINGRCLIDSAVVFASNIAGRPISRIEAGGGTTLNYQTFTGSPWDFLDIQSKIQTSWETATDDKWEIAKISIANKLKGFLGETQYWNLAFTNGAELKHSKEKLLVFFPTTDFEFPLYEESASARAFGGNQILAFKCLAAIAVAQGYSIAVRAHPHPFDKMKEEAENKLWQPICEEGGFIFIPSESKVDSMVLMKQSALNVVYESSAGIDSIALAMPTLILGTTDYGYLVPELCAQDSKTISQFFSKEFPIVEPSRIYPWAYYRSHGGIACNYFSREDGNFRYNGKLLETPRVLFQSLRV